MSQMHTSAAAAPIETMQPPTWLASYRRSYPGKADQVSRARKALRTFLQDRPRLDDAVMVGSELANNAITHSRSREPGGVYTLYATVTASLGATYVAVADAGGPWPHEGEVIPQHGLDVIQALAGPGNWGVDGNEDGRLVWACLLWPGSFPRNPAELEALMTADGDDPGEDLRKLAATLKPLGLAAELVTPDGRVPHLAVHVAGRPMPGPGVDIYAQADWYFLPTADRLALREDETRAAEAIARYLGFCDGTDG